MFKIGDKVRVINDYDDACKGDEGIIRALPSSYRGPTEKLAKCYSVEFPAWDSSRGHTCGGIVPSRRGQWVAPERLGLIKPKPEKIVITHDGKTTLARLYDGKKLVKTAEAKCDPRDEFAFKEGAKIAFERLTGEEEKSPKFDKAMLKNGRFGCTSDGKWFVVVGDHFVYEKGGWDEVSDINNEGIGEYYSIKYIVDANAFEYAKDKWAKVIWKAPDFDPKKVTNNA